MAVCIQSTRAIFTGNGGSNWLTLQIAGPDLVWGIGYNLVGRQNSLANQAYDALGRKTKITLPDGAFSLISYGANATEITDPNNGSTNVRIRLSNAPCSCSAISGGLEP